MDVNPYQAPRESVVRQPAKPTKVTLGGRFRWWGVWIGLASLIGFFSIFALAVLAGRNAPENLVQVFAVVATLCLVGSLGSLAAIALGVALDLFGWLFSLAKG